MTFGRKLRHLALAAAVGLTAAPVAAEELSLANFVPMTHIVNRSVIEPFAAALAADTNGALTIRIYPSGELGAGPAEQYARALQGVADITWGLQGYTSSQFPKTMVGELPGAFGPGLMGYDMLWNAFDPYLKDEYPGTKMLAMWMTEPSVFIMRDKVIRTPDDLKGLKIRIPGAIGAAVVEAMGATAIYMPAGEIYNALQTGLIDGVFTGASIVPDYKLDEVAKSFTVGVPGGHTSFFLVMNQARYDGLSDEFKAAIDKHSGRELSKMGEVAWNAEAERVLEEKRNTPGFTVVDLTEEEIAAFAALTLPVLEKVVAERNAADVLAAMRGE